MELPSFAEAPPENLQEMADLPSGDWRIFRQWVDRLQRAPVVEVDNAAPRSPVISVLVPTFNHAGYISQCLDSILAQDIQSDYEILVGEDVSIDSTRSICVEYARQRPDIIRLFLHDAENKIRINNIITGRFNFSYLLSRARGDFVCLCEGDDFWRDPTKLRKQIELMAAAPDVSLAFTDSLIMVDGQLTGESFLTPQQRRDVPREVLAVGARIPTQTVMFRNVFKAEPFPPDYFRAFNGDTYLFSYLSRFGSARYLGNILPAVYRVHDGGIWSGQGSERRLMLSIRTKQVMRGLHGDHDIRRRLDEEIFRLMVALAKDNMAGGRFAAAVSTVGRLAVLLFVQPHVHLPLIFRKLGYRIRGFLDAVRHAGH